MGEMGMSSQTEMAAVLSQIAQQLNRIAQALSSQGAAPEEANKLEESARALSTMSRQMADEAKQTRRASETARDWEQLRVAILRELLRGAALPVELAAVTFSLPEEIQPVLEDLERSELIAVQPVKGGRLVRLTAQGRAEARRILEGTRG